MWNGNFELEKQAFKHFKNIQVLKSNSYSVTVQKKENDKIFIVMESYFMNLNKK